MNEVIFSHRPRTGVSVAATSDGARLFLAMAFVNNGTSLNHVFHQDRCDAFSRPVARNILRGRLETLMADKDTDMGIVFETAMDARVFMAKFRDIFKPTQDESDIFLCEVEKRLSGNGMIETRYRLDPDVMFDRITSAANEIIADMSVTA